MTILICVILPFPPPTHTHPSNLPVSLLQTLLPKSLFTVLERHQEMVSKHLTLVRDDSQVEDDPDLENTSLTTEIKTFEDLLKRLDALEEEERVLDELIE